MLGLCIFSDTFQQYLMVSFIGGGKHISQRKHTDLQQVIDKLYHLMLYRVHLVMEGNWTHNFSVIGRCKSNTVSIYYKRTIFIHVPWYFTPPPHPGKRIERLAKARVSPVSKPRHINSKFTVNTPILYIYMYMIDFFKTGIDQFRWSMGGN